MNYREGEVIEVEGKEYIIYSVIPDQDRNYYYLMSNFKPIDMKFVTDGPQEDEMLVITDQEEKLRVFDLFRQKFN